MYEYLSLLSKPLDAQQIQACCVDKNTIVAAGAGSGKTQVLATRFAWLVMSKEIPVEKILTLTFTNKAASEMYERIYQMLVFFAQNPQTPQLEKERAKKAVENFSNSHIQTLDSYCGSVVRQAANRYGIRPNFTSGSADSGRTIKNLALPFLLQYRNDSAVLACTKPGKIQDTAEQLFAETILNYTSLADSDTFFEDALPKQKELIASEWNAVFEGTDSYGSLISNIADVYSQVPAAKKESAYCRALCSVFPFETGEISGVFDRLPEEIHLTKENIEDEKVQKAVADFTAHYTKLNFSQTLSGYTKELRASVKSIRAVLNDKIIPLAAYISQYKTAQRMYILLDQFLSQVNESKRRTGQLSFRDITELALRILNEQNDIRELEQNSYDRIMIDEFQDNNKKNRDLLFLLAGGKEKLFFVGDEKQSIYKFRGADVSVFKELQKDLNIEPLQMVFNYRSTQKLLEAFNQIFGGYVTDGSNWKKIPALSEEADAAPDSWVFPEKPENAFEASFTENNIARKNPALQNKNDENTDSKKNAPVHFCMYNTDEDKILLTRSENGLPVETAEEAFLTAKDQISYFIAQKILEIKKSMLLNGRPVKFQDIAILDKSRTDRSYLVKYLSRSGIPYTIDQHKNLFAEAPVNDIYNFLRICIYPSDMLSYAAFLSSPFASLSENAVEAVLACIKENCPEKIETELGSEEYEKYSAAESLQKEFTQFAVSHALTDTISKLWYEYGYRYETLWNKTVSLYAGQYDLLFELARRTDESGKSLSWFVDELDAKKNGSSFFGDDSDLDSENIDYPVEESDAVKIMTIHKSKGLQFPVVFVYGAASNANSEKNTDKTFFDETYGVSLNTGGGSANYFYKMQKDEADKKNEAEFKRLLYVGITRAENEVFITGDWKQPKKETSTSKDSMMEKILLRYYPDAAADTEYSRGQTVYNNDTQPLFDYTSIMPAGREQLMQSVNTGRENTAQAKKTFITEAAERYRGAETIKTEELLPPYISPSSLETASEIPTAAEEKNCYPELDTLISELQPQGFDFNDFGTLAHAYLEAFANGIQPKEFIPPSSMISVLLSAKNKTKRAEITAICCDMTHRFEKTAAAQKLKESVMHKTEYKFLHNMDGTLIRGTIDLLLKNQDGTLCIIDYKTDGKIQVEKYIEQQKCYRQAASAMFRVPLEKITCKLFYLRYAKEIDITSYC